jgi:hypothetical protein
MTDVVQFPFGDRQLTGRVVARQPDPQFDARDRVLLSVETDAGVYRVPESDATAV